MKFDIVPMFTKNLYKRFAAGIHSFAHPNERHELKQQECFLACSLADARQNEAEARYCANQSKERADRWEEQTQLYQEIVSLEQRLRAEDVRASEQGGFKNGYEQGHVDSARYRDQPIYDKGHVDGYTARVHDEQRLIVHESGDGGDGGHDGQLGEPSHSEIKRCDNSHRDNPDDDNSDSDNPNVENLNDYQLHGPREMYSPPRQPSTRKHGPMIERRPEYHSRGKPFFPWRGE